MAKVAGAALRFGQTGLRAIQLLASILILGIFSYFMASLTKHHMPIRQWIRGVEGISGAAVLYLLFAVLLTLFLGGHRFFAYIAVALDICFMGCFVAVTYLTRGGAGSCHGNVNTPLGSSGAKNYGFSSSVDTSNYTPNFHKACKLETAVFAVSLINVFLFIVTAVLQFLLARHHQKDKAEAKYATASSGKVPFWKRMGRKQKVHNTHDAEMATAATARTSHETGTTLNHGGVVEEPKYGQPGYGQHHNAAY